MILPLGIKKSMANQKFRIPFKNTSSSIDAEFDFAFVKMPKPDDEVDKQILQCMEFYC